MTNFNQCGTHPETQLTFPWSFKNITESSESHNSKLGCIHMSRFGWQKKKELFGSNLMINLVSESLIHLN